MIAIEMKMKTMRFDFKKILIQSCMAFSVVLFLACSENDGLGDDSENELEEIESPQAGFKGEIVWNKTYGGSLNDFGSSIVQTNDGGLAILGYSESQDGELTGKSRAGNDYWILKLDNEGTVQWSKTYGGSGDDIGTNMIQTNDGGYLLGGYSMSSDGDASKNEGFHDNWFVKLDASGSMEWEKSYGFSGHDHSYSLIQTKDGGYFSAGFLDVTASGGAGNETITRHGIGEFWGQKFDSKGELEWRRYYGGTNNDRAYKVLQAKDGGFMMFGLTESDDFDIENTNGSYEFWVVKLDEGGEMLWEKTFGGSGIEQAYDAAPAKDGGFVIVGQGYSNDGDATGNHGSSDVWVIKIDEKGKLLWQKMLGGSNFELAQGVASAKDGSFFITGNSRSTDGDILINQGENDFLVIQLSGEGDLLWENTYGGSGIDLAQSISVSSDEKVTLIGSTESTNGDIEVNKGLNDLWVLQIK